MKIKKTTPKRQREKWKNLLLFEINRYQNILYSVTTPIKRVPLFTNLKGLGTLPPLFLFIFSLSSYFRKGKGRKEKEQEKEKGKEEYWKKK